MIGLRSGGQSPVKPIDQLLLRHVCLIDRRQIYFIYKILLNIKFRGSLYLLGEFEERAPCLPFARFDRVPRAGHGHRQWALSGVY